MGKKLITLATSKKVAALIRAKREALHMSRRDLARHCRLGQSTIAQVELGVRPGSRRTLETLCGFFRLDAGKLLGV